MDQDIQSDDQLDRLVQQAQKGSELACEQLYYRYADLLFRLSYGILLSEQDAEEVVQDSFVYAFQTIHRFDPSKSAFKTWIYGITMSRCRNKRRRKWLPTVQLGEFAEHIADDILKTEELVSRKLMREEIRLALRHLSPKVREAIVLRYFDGLTYREMAQILRCPQKTAESRVRLGHTTLYKILTDQQKSWLEEFAYHD